MDAHASIQKRYGFALPDLYQTLLAKGHFSSKPWKNYLSFDDCEWLSPENIATYKFLDFQITSDGGFVPVAVSARRDEWCWRLDWATSAEPPIVFCERGESGFGYAPDFRGFLYRKALEEFAGHNDFSAEAGKLADLQRAVGIITPHLPGPWAKQLRQLADCDLGAWQEGDSGELYVLPNSDLEAVIASKLAFPHLNETFEQDKERANRTKS